MFMRSLLPGPAGAEFDHKRHVTYLPGLTSLTKALQSAHLPITYWAKFSQFKMICCRGFYLFSSFVHNSLNHRTPKMPNSSTRKSYSINSNQNLMSSAGPLLRESRVISNAPAPTSLTTPRFHNRDCFPTCGAALRPDHSNYSSHPSI